MKASKETIERVRAAVAPFDTEANREAYRAGRFPRADRVQNLDRRYRWDLAYAADRAAGGGWDGLIASLYDEGLNDAHIETVLRAVVPPLG